MSMMRKVGMGLFAAGVAGALVWAFWPQPVQVDMASVTRADMRGEILAQGVTRVRAPYAIAAPITGTATRSPVEVGDRVVAGESVVAILQPSDPALMDARARAQAEAAIAEAQAAVALARTSLRQAETELTHAATQLERGRALAARGTIAQRMLEDIEAAYQSAEQARAAAEQQLELNRATLLRAEAQLMGPQSTVLANGAPGECCLRILAPQSGIVLAVSDQSARLVQAGAPLLTIGNLDEMEVELDLLSTDAVQVPPGARAIVERWGGEGTLEARLRRIEPAAFTRVSALGIEEQRVRLRLDLLTPPEGRAGLGEGFRVHLRLILWEDDDILQVPQAALFRHAQGWAVFIDDAGRARLRMVTIGRQAADRAEVLDGLAEGDRVILYPASALQDGAAIAARQG
ncbi:efflux RND transporter periplasmic adaptor subunit [Roseinatronobacter sp.]